MAKRTSTNDAPMLDLAEQTIVDIVASRLEKGSRVISAEEITLMERARKPYPIPGSVYWRNWCCCCDEPIRVSLSRIKVATCDDCVGPSARSRRMEEGRVIRKSVDDGPNVFETIAERD